LGIHKSRGSTAVILKLKISKGVVLTPFFLYFFLMNRKSTLDEFIIYLEKRIQDEDFRNSVEKITFMTTLHVIKKNLGEK